LEEITSDAREDRVEFAGHLRPHRSGGSSLEMSTPGLYQLVAHPLEWAFEDHYADERSMMTATPKAFISHATLDKQRFVLGFATKLRENGVDAWLDQWEMGPGDSLVDRIFEEGIKNAHAFVVVLSENSVHRTWVREELNVALVRKIEGLTKLIPVIIDDCEIPEALRSTVWVKIDDLDHYDANLAEIVDAIFGNRDKPPIGQAPTYTRLTDRIGTLDTVDSAVLRAACEQAIRKGHIFLGTGEIIERLTGIGLTQEQVAESLEVLTDGVYIEASRAMGEAVIQTFEITSFGLEQYARQVVPKYDELIESVAFEIVNRGAHDSQAIIASSGQPAVLVEHALAMLKQQGLINYESTWDGSIIYDVSPRLRRILARGNQGSGAAPVTEQEDDEE
jgi:hypothetical protein